MAKPITTEAITTFINEALIEAIQKTLISQGALYNRFKDHEDELLPQEYTSEILQQALEIRKNLVNELVTQIQTR